MCISLVGGWGAITKQKHSILNWPRSNHVGFLLFQRQPSALDNPACDFASIVIFPISPYVPFTPVLYELEILPAVMAETPPVCGYPPLKPRDIC